MGLEVRVPAKINLWLEVIRKRDDGYHELSSLMLPVAIYDCLELDARAGSGISLECDAPGVPSDAGNLAWRAAEAFLEALGTNRRVTIRIGKRIPAAAGLGGGSADAAAVLRALNHLHGDRLSMPELEKLGRKLGADVPFFLHQTPCLATGIGDRLQRVDGLPDFPLVLIKPPLTVSTASVYQSLKLTRGKSHIKLSRFMSCPWELGEVMENDLEMVTLSTYPVLAEIKQWLLENGAAGALMSGSGPTIYGVCRERRQAEALAAKAQRAWKGCWVAATHVCGKTADNMG